MSINILFLLSDKDRYYKYNQYIKEHTLTKESSQILKDMHSYFSDHPSKTEICWDEFGEWFRTVQNPMFKDEKQQLYQEIFNALNNKTSLDGETEEQLLNTFIERDYATRLADLALKVAEGTKRNVLSNVQQILDAYHHDVGKVAEMDSLEVTDSLQDIMQKVKGTGLEWRLNCLNRSLGPLRKGDFIILGKRPETGGTTFLASEATHMAPQLEDDEVVLWFNNEEQGWKVKYRAIQAGIGWETSAMEADPVGAMQEYDRLVGDGKIKIVDKGDLSVRDVNNFLKKYKAGLIIFDQLWKVHGFEKRAGNDVTNQTLLANQAREWAKEHAPVINVHQADGSAEGVLYPDMSQLYYSKTGVQGEADGIIMLGKSNQAGFEMVRGVNICKNKMHGGAKTVESEKHGRYEIEIVPHLARFKEK